MRWISDVHSAEREEVTVLAIVETIAAVSVSIGIFVHTGHLYHIAIATCLAPFLLLRTRRSIRNGLRHGNRAARRLDWFANDIVGLLLIPLVFPLEITIGKVRATLSALFTHPRETISAIPTNWKKIALCTDIGSVPEIMPGIETMPFRGDIKGIQLGGIYRSIWKDFRSDGFTLISVPIVLLYLIVTLVSLAYRWSLKSTALIWSPLLWYMRPVYAAEDLNYRLDQILRLAMSKVVLWYSVFFVGFFIGKIYLLSFASEHMNLVASLPGWTFLRHLFVPEGLPIWQIASFVNAVLGISIFFIADYLHHAIKHNQTIPAQTIVKIDRVLSDVRNTITCYTVLCTAYITVQQTMPSLPPIGLRPFPWWA